MVVTESGDSSAVEMEEQKKNLAGLAVWTERENWTKWWRPLMWCSSKLPIPKVKLTLHALWMIKETSFLIIVSIKGSMPKSCLEKSQDKATTLTSKVGGILRPR